MANEDASLQFSLLQIAVKRQCKSSSHLHAETAALHKITVSTCLLSRSFHSLVKKSAYAACEVVHSSCFFCKKMANEDASLQFSLLQIAVKRQCKRFIVCFAAHQICPTCPTCLTCPTKCRTITPARRSGYHDRDCKQTTFCKLWGERFARL